MNNRANIMYFLEHHVEVNGKEGGHANYVEMVRRDIERIVEAVSGSGANVKVARKVVGSLGEKGVLSGGAVEGLERGLKEKEERLGSLLGDEEGIGGGEGEMEDVQRSESQRATPRSKEGKVNGVHKLDKRAIEQRIEEDRERNKRLRESVWAVNGDDEQELDKMWEEGSELEEDDYVIALEEAEERNAFARYHRSLDT